MHPIHLSFSLYTLIIIIIIFFFFFSGDVSSTNETFSECNRTFTCGSFHNITYPFTGGDRPEYCGLPQFNLSCRNEFPELTIGKLTYRVLHINQTQQTLLLARLDLWNNTCTQEFINSTLDSTSFNFGIGNQALTLSYSCTTLREIPPTNQFSCNVSGNSRYAYYLIGPVPVDPIFRVTSCSVSVAVPILMTAAVSLADKRTSLQEALIGGFNVNYSIPYNTSCSRCLKSDGQCGYDSISSKFRCFCGDELCSETAGDGVNLPAKMAVGISAGVAGVIVAFVVVICWLKRQHISGKTVVLWKKKSENDKNVEAFIRNNGFLTLKRYSYPAIKKMTKSFKEKLGQGGYGGVYKGKLFDGRLVAVKVLSESKGNGEEFINEVASISRTSHVNIVSLLGFCYEGTKRALVYEFMPNGSLDKFIYDEGSSNGDHHLEWKTLYQIAIGIARGLEYLHRGCNTRILHFDIKPHNILLDEDFCPKVSDFGLAKLCQRKESIISMIGARGTIGYIAPEVFSRNFGGVSHKSDVYSFGMMVLEMVGGRKNIDPGVSHTSEIYFPHWIYEPLKRGEDLKLHRVVTEEEKEITRKLILVSLWCIQTNPSDRPSMTKVVEMLEGSLQSLQIPPKPYLSSPSRSPQRYSSTTSTLS